VLPHLSQVSGVGEFNEWDKAELSPATLSGGESKKYEYTLSDPNNSGTVELKGTVTAKTDSGESIPSDPVTATVAIGPSITGTIYDVRLNGSKGIKNYISGKDLDKGMKIWVDESSPLKTGGTIRAVSLADDSQVAEAAVDPKDGSYTLALPGPGTYEVSMDGIPESNVGFNLQVTVDSETVKQDFRVPHSLVLQTRDLINAYEHIKLQLGSFENIAGGNLITLGYYSLVNELDQYLDSFRDGAYSPPYENLWQGQSDTREATHDSVKWDALIRLDAALIFNLRRISEASSLAVEAVQNIVPYVMALTAAKDQKKKSKSQPDTRKAYENIAKLSNIFVKNIGSTGLAFDNPTTDEEKKLQALYNEVIKWIATIVEVVIKGKNATDKLANGQQEFLKEATVYAIVATSTKLYINEFFIKKCTSPALKHALARAEKGDLHGSTERVLEDLEKLDELIIKNLNHAMDELNRYKQAEGAFNDLNDILGGLDQLREELETLLGGSYSPAKVCSFLKDSVTLLKNFYAGLVALQSVDIMRKLFIDKPGQVCVAADQAYSATPDLMLDASTRFLTCTLGGR